MSPVITELEKTPLWQAFAEKTKNNDGQRQMVKDLVQKASDRLNLVRDTFPTYTLHNYVHSLNVVKRMGDLLGSSVKTITPLEGTILILSAFFHDIGMVFTEDERQKLDKSDKSNKEREDFKKFLKKYPKAYVSKQEAREVTSEIAEWYCRWIHPKRVHYYLEHLTNKEKISISWENSPFQYELGYVCESHGQDKSELLALSSSVNNQSPKLSTDFLGEADLLFCAIILRLADILDFDNTRSPDELYEYLDLSSKQNQQKAVSDREWCKHFSSNGFKFPNSTDRQEGYTPHGYNLRFCDSDFNLI